MKESIGVSQFFYEQTLNCNYGYNPDMGLHLNDLMHRISESWELRKPGVGRHDTSQVVVVPLNLSNSERNAFTDKWIPIESATNISGDVVKRSENEDSYITLSGDGDPLENRFFNAVLYRAETLLENNGSRSTLADWEIVAMIASPWDSEPMMPLTMARNFLEAPGGTYAPYDAEEFAKSIYHWSRFVKKRY